MEKNRKYRCQWAGCSDIKERTEKLLQAHEEFLKMQEQGWFIKEIKPKRPRIQRNRTPKQVIIKVFGCEMKMTFAFIMTLSKICVCH